MSESDVESTGPPGRVSRLLNNPLGYIVVMLLLFGLAFGPRLWKKAQTIRDNAAASGDTRSL